MMEVKGWEPEDYMALLNPVAFARRFLNIEPQPWQKTVLETLQRHKQVGVLAARQMGKTETMRIFATWKLCAFPERKVLIFAPAKHQAVDILFKRIKQSFEKSYKLSLLVKKNQNGKKILLTDYVELINGGFAKALPASDVSNIEGWTATDAFLDESQNISDFTFWKRIIPMISQTDGNIIQIGTPRGKNHFYTTYKSKDWKFLAFNWKYGTPKYRKRVEQLKKEMPPFDFATEYELKWIEDDELFFKTEDINAAIEDYEIPYMTQSKIYAGLDIAQKQDKTILTFVTVEGKFVRVVAIYELVGKYTDQVPKVAELLDRFDIVKLYMDATGVGAPFYDLLIEEVSYPYRVTPYVFTQKSKADELYANLDFLFSSRKMIIPNHQPLLEELYSLQRTITKSGNILIHHPPRGHDDFADSLSLACFAARDEMKKPTGSFVGTIGRVKGKLTGKIVSVDRKGEKKIWLLGKRSSGEKSAK